jgi:hypothetical protein
MTRTNELSATKRALLERWRSGRVALEGGSIPRRDPAQPAPLSVQQERFWLLEQLTPGTSAFTLSFAAWLHGDVDASALGLAVVELARRHESMRTTVGLAAEGPVQEIAAEPAVRLELHDAGSVPAPRRVRESLRLVTTALREPFDLARGPLARTWLVSLQPDLHLFAIIVHHLVSDGWSLGVALTELRALYERHAAGESPALPAPVMQYGDVAAWQRSWLQEGRWRANLPWWRDRLAGAEPPALPVDRPRPALPSLRCHSRPFTLPADLSRGLRDLGRREGVTLFVTLLTGFVALLAGASGQTQVAVGSPTANRPHAETFGVIGVFINTLVLRVDLSGDPTLREVLRRVRAVTLQALAHQDVPFEELVQDLRSERDLDSSPLFQALFVLQNSPMPELGFGGARMEPVELPSGSCMVDLEVHLWDREPEIGGRLNASADVFEAATADRLVRRLLAALEMLAADPGRRLGSEGAMRGGRDAVRHVL